MRGRRQFPRPRGAFTLIEILLALALMLLVVTLAYSGMVLFRNVTTAGRDQALQAQLARAIEQRMRADLRSVLFHKPKQGGQGSLSGTGASMGQRNSRANGGSPTSSSAMSRPSSSSASPTNPANSSPSPSTTANPSRLSSPSSGAMSNGSTTIGTPSSPPVSTAPPASTLTPMTAYSSQSAGLFGNATTLVLHVSNPRRESARALGTMAGTQMGVPQTGMGDLRSVCYFLATSGTGTMQGAVGTTVAGGSPLLSLGQDAQGLARLGGDRLRLAMANTSGNLNLLSQQAQILAPEVTFLRFRYFNGTAWVATWNSAAAGALPRAIEVTMRIDTSRAEGNTAASPQQEESSSATATAKSAQGLTYRFVVTLPTSNPTMGLPNTGMSGTGAAMSGTGGLP